MLDVYAICEAKDGETRSRWVKVGVAFRNGKDGSINVLLDALPLTGRLQIRERDTRPPEKMVDGSP